MVRRQTARGIDGLRLAQDDGCFDDRDGAQSRVSACDAALYLVKNRRHCYGIIALISQWASLRSPIEDLSVLAK
jgi:hypothetical protein